MGFFVSTRRVRDRRQAPMYIQLAGPCTSPIVRPIVADVIRPDLAHVKTIRRRRGRRRDVFTQQVCPSASNACSSCCYRCYNVAYRQRTTTMVDRVSSLPFHGVAARRRRRVRIEYEHSRRSVRRKYFRTDDGRPTTRRFVGHRNVVRGVFG